MDQKAKNQKANILITQYIKLYKERYGKPPLLNRYKERWGFADMIEDLGARDAGRVIDRFFKMNPPHTTVKLFRMYDDIMRWIIEDEEDEALRAELREKTKQRVKDWEAKWQPKKN